MGAEALVEFLLLTVDEGFLLLTFHERHIREITTDGDQFLFRRHARLASQLLDIWAASNGRPVTAHEL
jgi:hypothetical protein